MADEYISREAALADFESCNAENPNWTPQRVKTLLLRQPAADVAEVVRCRACKHLVNATINANGFSHLRHQRYGDCTGRFLQLRRVSDKYRGERKCFRLSFYLVACSRCMPSSRRRKYF